MPKGAERPPLKIKRIDCSAHHANSQLAALHKQFSSDGEVVSARDKKLTQAVFGEALSPARSVERICNDVRDHGLASVIKYTEAFDKVKLTPDTVRVTPEELQAAFRKADTAFIDAIRRIRDSIVEFQLGLLHGDALLPVSGLYELQLRYRPLRRIGVCVPGGQAAYPSTILMTVCPAQAAGVKEIAVVMPPTPNGAYNADMLAVCHLLGIKEVYRIGGAQAVAALAFGADPIPPVDMIVGPGTQFVALAKKHVFGKVAIDCIAGPSEIIVVADQGGRPNYISSDLIAQAEHAPGAAILITWHAPLIDAVSDAIQHQLTDLSRGDLARESLEKFGAFILCADEDEAVEITNNLAPEHLHVQTRDPERFADRIDNAGAIFLGAYTPVALGDYAAGPSHVLPTGGTARFTSGLSANDFLRRTSVMSFTLNGLRDLQEDVLLLANREGLTGHANSVSIRMREQPTPIRPPKKTAEPKVDGKADGKPDKAKR